MAINNSYDEKEVVEAIAKALETFYGSLIEKIDTLDIKRVMKRKNPYLYRAKAANRLIREFSNSFCKEDGSIDWEKLVEFNSGD